ncbi:MAG TPA: DUF5317 family protein [Chloroflexota bacterium]|jgi:hypothetical protein
MIGLLGLTLLGFLLGLAVGGTLDGWRDLRLRWWLPALLALIVQLFLYNPPFDSEPWALAYGPAIFIVAKAVLVATLLANALGTTTTPLRAAWLVATLGVGLNLAVVAANGGYMPQSESARFVARGATLLDEQTLPKLRNVKPIDESTQLAFLGDVVAQPAWMPRSNVISIGDVLLTGGLGWWAFQITVRVRRSPLARPTPADS